MMEPDEQALILRVKQGDLEAFEALMGLHMRRVRTGVALRAPVAQLVDEVAHDTFVYAFQHIAEFETGTSFQAWLVAIAHNLLRTEVLRFSRQATGRERYATECLVRAAQARVSEKTVEELEQLEVCLRRLPSRLRELLDMRYKNGLATENVAEALHRSVAWVRTTLCRARKELRRCIETRLAAEQP